MRFHIIDKNAGLNTSSSSMNYSSSRLASASEWCLSTVCIMRESRQDADVHAHAEELGHGSDSAAVLSGFGIFRHPFAVVPGPWCSSTVTFSESPWLDGTCRQTCLPRHCRIPFGLSTDARCKHHVSRRIECGSIVHPMFVAQNPP